MSDMLYFYGPGTCSLSSQIILAWHDMPYYLCRIDGPARQTAAYRHINPHARVPALRVDGRIIVENAAIIAHLADKRPGILPPPGTAARDVANTWLAYIGTTLHVAFAPIFSTGRYSRYEAMHPAIRDAAKAQIKRQLGYVNRALNDAPFVLGQHISGVDAYLYAISRWGKSRFNVPVEFPQLHQHHLRMQDDPGVQFALAVDKRQAEPNPQGGFRGHVDLAQA